MTAEEIDRIPEGRQIEGLIAEGLLGYRRQPVGPDAHGQNAGEILVPPGDRRGFAYPRVGGISLYYHVRHYTTDPEDALELVAWMQEHGSSLILNWGEDNDLWEVSWISSGERFTGFAPDWKLALCRSAAKAAVKKRSAAKDTE